MHGVGFDIPLGKWFNCKVPSTTIPPNYIQREITQVDDSIRKNAFVIWLGALPAIDYFEIKQGKKSVRMAELRFYHKKQDFTVEMPVASGEFWTGILPQLSVAHFQQPFLYQQLQTAFEKAQLGHFDTFRKSEIWHQLRKNGLLIL